MQKNLASELVERNKLLKDLFYVKHLTMKEKPKKAKKDKLSSLGSDSQKLVKQAFGKVRQSTSNMLCKAKEGVAKNTSEMMNPASGKEGQSTVKKVNQSRGKCTSKMVNIAGE